MNDTPLPDDHGVRHETTDVAARGILLFAGGLALVIAATVGGILWMVAVYARDAQSRQPPPPPRAMEGRPPLPPQPRLEGIDMDRSEHDVGRVWEHGSAAEQARAEEARLHSYGWADRGAGRAYIPIEEAMKLFASRQPPGRPAPPDQFWREPSRSSAGRQPRGGQP